MKKSYLNVISLAILIFAVCCTTVEDQKVIHIIKTPGESATIKVPDLESSLKIMQITDSHISIEDEMESDMMQYAERMHNAYSNPRKHYKQDISKSTFEYLDDLLQKAKEENVELLLLTGDIVNFPSAVSVQYVNDRLTKNGIPWLYISGNHDWHYEGMAGTMDSLRLIWIEESLLPLYEGHNPLYYSEIINGINFVGIDNSTNQINSDQIDFLKKQLAMEEPIILISHIPYKLNSEENQAGMDTFINIISSNYDKIIAIFTGHSHRSSYYFTGNFCQYISPAAFQGASFIVDVVSR